MSGTPGLFGMSGGGGSASVVPDALVALTMNWYDASSVRLSNVHVSSSPAVTSHGSGSKPSSEFELATTWYVAGAPPAGLVQVTVTAPGVPATALTFCGAPGLSGTTAAEVAGDEPALLTAATLNTYVLSGSRPVMSQLWTPGSTPAQPKLVSAPPVAAVTL